MPLRVGGVRIGPTDDDLLDRLANLWVEAEEVGGIVRRLERKRNRQERWLDENGGDPRFMTRYIQSRVDQDEFVRQLNVLHEIAGEANKIVDGMDEAGRERARKDVHVWAATGSDGVYAIAWKIVPTPDVLNRVRAKFEERRARMVVPF